MLTQHSNAHVLERHGHDVTDDALIRRATTGKAPDGNPGSKPPYSSKFESAAKLKNALDNIKPGTPAFNNKVPSGSNWKVEFNGSFGYGIPKNGGSPVNMTKVTAFFEEVSPGNYHLITMYPNI